MSILEELANFNMDEAAVSLWVFKGPRGPSGSPPTYTARWVDTNEEVDIVLKEVVKTEVGRIEETADYDLLAQPNEASGLLISTEETYADRLVEAVSAETQELRADSAKKLQNSTFYIAKFVEGESVLYAVRRTSSIWKTKRAISARSLILADNTLALDDTPRFDIESTIDFFILNGEILILHKGRFESTLRYKAAHAEDFLVLQQEPKFADLFVDLAPLVEHVGTNKIQLRRMCSIHQKAHYRNDEFMKRVRENHAKYGLDLQFDPDGRIFVTPETGGQVITALLDHRLASGFSNQVYDVPSATPISV